MKKLYEETDIQAVADAIREKNGSTDTYKVSEMAQAIRNIPTKDTSNEAIDIENSGYTYTETDEPIEKGENENEVN